MREQPEPISRLCDKVDWMDPKINEVCIAFEMFFGGIGIK